jgi:chromosome segregation ATPase
VSRSSRPSESSPNPARSSTPESLPVNDILAEVDRQRNSLKRQAGKARRYIELRNRMREILSAVFSTRAEMLVLQQESVNPLCIDRR